MCLYRNSPDENTFIKILQAVPDLISVWFELLDINQLVGKAIGKFVNDVKLLQTIEFKYCFLRVQGMKEIADGFVRAKKLENFRAIACNAETGSLTQCISNLAFIPNLKVIDTYETSGYFFSDLDIESFLKVLKISGSIEYIRFSKNFNNHLRMFTRKDVCLALAHNKTIKTLDI